MGSGPPSVAHRRDWLLVLGGFAVSRLLARGLYGVEFDDNPLLWFWQYIDPALLREDVLRSVFYHHAQPPLFNLYLSAVLKSCGESSGACFSSSYLALGAGLHLGLFALILRLGVERRLALCTALVFAFTPASMLYESWLFYTYPLAALLVFSALFVHRSVAGDGRRRDLAVAAALFAAAVLTRSLFHLIWLAGALALIAWPLRHRARRVVLCAALPVLLCVGVYAKNALLFGEFTSSSWLGMSVARLAVEPLPLPERLALVEAGTIGRVSLLRPFSPVEQYPPGLRRGAPAFHPVLSETHKSTRAPNYNHGAFLAISRAYRRDALALLWARPDVYAQSVLGAWSQFAMPPSLVLFLQTNRDRLGGYADVFTAALYGFVRDPVPPDALGEDAEPRYQLHSWGLVFLLLAAGAVARGAVRGAREWLGAGGDRALGATLLFCTGTALYVAVVGNLLELGENNRFRFMIEPFLFAGIAWLLDGLLRRRRAGVD